MRLVQKVKDTMIALPPLEEQKEIVATIEKLFTLCNELESEINQNKTTVDNLNRNRDINEYRKFRKNI